MKTVFVDYVGNLSRNLTCINSDVVSFVKPKAEKISLLFNTVITVSDVAT